MGKKTIITVLAIVLISLILIVHFKFQWFRSFTDNAIDAVPFNAAIIIECNNTQSSWEKLAATTLWQDMIEQKYLSKLNQNYRDVDSLIRESEELTKLMSTRSLVISIHPTKIDDYDFLYLLKLPEYKGETYINNIVGKILSKETKLEKRKYEGVSIYEIALPSEIKEMTYYTYAIVKGIFIGSFSSIIVEDAIRQLNKGITFNSDKSYSKVRSAAGANVDANVYLNYFSILFLS